MNGGAPKLCQRTFFKSLWMVFRILSIALFLLILLMAFPHAIKHVHNAGSYSWVVTILEAEQAVRKPMLSFIRQFVPTKVMGTDVALWLAIIGLFIAGRTLANIGERMYGRAEQLRYRNELKDFMAQRHISEDNAVIAEMNRDLVGLEPGKKKDRDKLLEVFANAKKKLDAMGRSLAFLSIDIVDSTGMKIGEDHCAVEHDFKQYKEFLTGILETRGALKSAWTPDGVMISFTRIQDAVAAAQDVIRNLPAFNSRVKLMKRDFLVRCGANEGFVYLDDSLPLEEVSDRVIDIAGHMQKHAEPSSLFLPESAVAGIGDNGNFVSVDKEIDGVRVAVWKPERTDSGGETTGGATVT